MPHAVTSTSDGKSYRYDCNGNMVPRSGGHCLGIATTGRPPLRVGSGTTTFTYSGDGARLKKPGPVSPMCKGYPQSYESAHAPDRFQMKILSSSAPLTISGGQLRVTPAPQCRRVLPSTGTAWGA